LRGQSFAAENGFDSPGLADAPISDDDSTESRNRRDEEAQTPFELLPIKTCGRSCGFALTCSDDRERRSYSRFGSMAETKTLEEVGKKIGVTRERIRQLQNMALETAVAQQKRAPGDVELTGKSNQKNSIWRAEGNHSRAFSSRSP